MTAYNPFIAGEIWTATICNALAGGWISIDGAGVFTYASADSPTFVMNTPADCTGFIGVGQRIKLTQSGVVAYFIVTAITATTITLYGGTDYTLANSGISLVSSSPWKAPAGFPTDPLLWTVSLRDTTLRAKSNPTQNVWYSPGGLSISIPIGAWSVELQVMLGGDSNNANMAVAGSLSTANNSESDPDFTGGALITAAGVTAENLYGSHSRRKNLTLASKTTYYPVISTQDASMTEIEFLNTYGAMNIRAISAYL